MAKWKIDEKWDGKEHDGKIYPKQTVVHDLVEYGPGQTFSAPASLGKGRPWLISEKAAKKATKEDETKEDEIEENEIEEDAK